MARKSFSRRLLSALAGSTPAFTRDVCPIPQNPARRLLSALAGSTPAFTPGGGSDQHTFATPPDTKPIVNDSTLPSASESAQKNAGIDDPQITATNKAPTEAVRLASELAQFADEFAVRPAQERLAARSRPEHAEIQLSLALLDALSKSRIAWPSLDIEGNLDIALDIVRAFDTDYPLARDFARARARDVVRDLDRDVEDIFALVFDVALARDLALARDIDIALDIDSGLALARDRALDIALDLARALARDLDLDRDLALAFDHDLGRAFERDVDLFRDLNRALDLGRALERALALARDRALDLARALFLLRALHRAIANFVGRVRGTGFTRQDDVTELQSATEMDLVGLSRTLRRLESAGRNMIDTDLRELRLRDIRERERVLDGVRHSTSTLWPPELQEWVDQHSEQIGLGLYEIHSHDDSHNRATSRT